MRSRPVKRSSLFLLELIIAILFFSMASAVCVRFFVKSHTLSQDTGNLNRAVNLVSGQAELFLAQEDYARYMEEDGAVLEETEERAEYRTYYDEEWKACGAENAAFEMHTVIERDGVFLRGSFCVTAGKDAADGGREIYALTVDKYTGREAVR